MCQIYFENVEILVKLYKKKPINFSVNLMDKPIKCPSSNSKLNKLFTQCQYVDNIILKKDASIVYLDTTGCDNFS